MAALFASGGSPLVDQAGNQVEASVALAGTQKVVLYFSASWCPDCQAFSPQLRRAYEQLNNGKEKAFELVLVSSEESAEAVAKSHKDELHSFIPLRVAFDHPLREELKRTGQTFANKESGKFPGVKRKFGIPCLRRVTPDGALEDAGCEEGSAILEFLTKDGGAAGNPALTAPTGGAPADASPPATL